MERGDCTDFRESTETAELGTIPLGTDTEPAITVEYAGGIVDVCCVTLLRIIDSNNRVSDFVDEAALESWLPVLLLLARDATSVADEFEEEYPDEIRELGGDAEFPTLSRSMSFTDSSAGLVRSNTGAGGNSVVELS